MLRYITDPLDAGGFEGDTGVEAAGDGTVDNGLLLFLQQLDQLLLGADVLPNPPVHVIEESNDGGLFGEGWKKYCYSLQVWPIKIPLDSANTLGANEVLANHRLFPKEKVGKLGLDPQTEGQNQVGRTDYPLVF